jgi:multiple antibiotic resistance protein
MLRLVFDAFKNYRGFRRGPSVAHSIMLEQPLKFFVVFFVVVEPISLIPLFTGLTAGATRHYKRRMALKAVGVSAVILLLFALGGASFLKLMGISLEAFRIFGGLLLFLLALEMVFARESGTRTSSSAGPGALATILLWFGPLHLAGQAALFAALLAAAALVLAIALALLLLADPLMRVIGVTGANVAARLLGVVLGALAVQFVLDGLRQAFGVN